MRKFFSRKFSFLFHSSDEWFFMPVIFLSSRSYIVSCMYHMHTHTVLTTVNIYSFFSFLFSPPIEKLFSFLYFFFLFFFFVLSSPKFYFYFRFFCCFHFGFPLHDYFLFFFKLFPIKNKKKRKTKNFFWIFGYDS